MSLVPPTLRRRRMELRRNRMFLINNLPIHHLPSHRILPRNHRMDLTRLPLLMDLTVDHRMDQITIMVNPSAMVTRITVMVALPIEDTFNDAVMVVDTGMAMCMLKETDLLYIFVFSRHFRLCCVLIRVYTLFRLSFLFSTVYSIFCLFLHLLAVYWTRLQYYYNTTVPYNSMYR